MDYRTFHDVTRRGDILLAGHEDENVSGGIGQVDLQDLLDGTVDVVFAWRLAVEDFDGESPAGNRVGRGITKETRELQEKRIVRAVLATKIDEPTLSAFIVAEVTISLRSLRRVRTTDAIS